MKTLLSVNRNHHICGGSDVMYFEHARLFGARGWNLAYHAMHDDNNINTKYSKYFAKHFDHESGSIVDKMINATKIIYSSEARHGMRRLLDEHPIDVAHVHVVFHHQSPSVLLELKQRGIPTVLTAHDLKMLCPAFQMHDRHGICEKCKGKRVWNVAINRCMMDSFVVSAWIAVESAVHQWLNIYGRNVDRIVVPSKFYLDKFVEWGWPAAQLIHQPNIINPVSIPLSPMAGPYVLYFGRLSPEKGITTLIHAAARAGVPLKIAGTGPIEADLRKIAQDLRADVEFLGFRTGADLWRVVDGARVIVIPSEWYENGPMSAIEANLRGKALLGAEIGGIPELIEPGDTGWLFRAGDVDDLACKLALVAATSDDDIMEIGKAAKEAAERRHSPDIYYENMVEIYRSIGAPV